MKTKTKTIKFDDYWKISEDGKVLECFTCFTSDEYDETTGKVIKPASYGYEKTPYKIGEKAVLVSHEDVSPNALRDGGSIPQYHLHFDLEGVPGNSNHNIKKTTGWRGTTNDNEVYAHGIWKIMKFNKLKKGVSVTLKFVED